MYGRVEVVIHMFISSALNGTSEEEPWYPLDSVVSGPQSQTGQHEEKNLCRVRNLIPFPWTSSPQLNHHTELLHLWSQQRQPLLGNGSANTPVARQQLHKHTTIPEPSLSNVPMQQWRSCWKQCFLCGPCQSKYSPSRESVSRGEGL
jgi:hypothetical protein